MWSIPQIVFSADEALSILSQIDCTLSPRSQVYNKIFRKWEAFRDDSAHYAIRLFTPHKPGQNDFAVANSLGTPDVEGFWYRYDDGMLIVGDERKKQEASVIDALDALRATFNSLERTLESAQESHPKQKSRFPDIDREISCLSRELLEPIDRADEWDAMTALRYDARKKAITKLLSKSPKTEAALLEAVDFPKSIAREVLGQMVRENSVTATRSTTDYGWIFSRNSQKTRAKSP